MTKGLQSRYFNLREEEHQMNSDLDELSCSRLHFIQSPMSLMQLVETDLRCWTSVELGRQKLYIYIMSHRRKDACPCRPCLAIIVNSLFVVLSRKTCIRMTCKGG